MTEVLVQKNPSGHPFTSCTTILINTTESTHLYPLCVIHIKILVLIKIQFVVVKPVTIENKYTYHILPLMTAETVTHIAQSDS